LESLIALGYPGLFIASFLAATIVPFSSEAILGAMLLGPYSAFACLFWATFGNWAGGLTSYALGWAGRADKVERFLHISPQKVAKVDPYIKKWGVWLALFCWLPFIGDLFAVALGFARTNIYLTSIFMLAGKALRYVAVYYFVYALA